MVDSVELPPWARGDPARLIALHRAALESPRCKRALPLWLDLVFGYKQRGPHAAFADNGGRWALFFLSVFSSFFAYLRGPSCFLGVQQVDRVAVVHHAASANPCGLALSTSPGHTLPKRTAVTGHLLLLCSLESVQGNSFFLLCLLSAEDLRLLQSSCWVHQQVSPRFAVVALAPRLSALAPVRAKIPADSKPPSPKFPRCPTYLLGFQLNA